MRILLVGEFSRLHNSLKEGLLALGHDVIIIASGDGFKNYPVDIRLTHSFSNPILKKLRTLIYKLTSIDLGSIELYNKAKRQLDNLTGFDIVQLINETSIKAHPKYEIKFLEHILKRNDKLYLLSCGVDYYNMKYMMDGNFRYSFMTPYLKGEVPEDNYQFKLKQLAAKNKKLHDFILEHSRGVIATDMDYHLPLMREKKYLGLIPNAINTDLIDFIPLSFDGKIKIFHGVNKSAIYKKGNNYFFEALEIIKEKYAEKIEIITVYSLPYDEYIKSYNSCHILLDQVFSYDQGYNALEAMAKGKVVFTGAEKEWLEHYNLEEDTVAINVLPDAEQIASKLEWLILNPDRILDISKNARAFIEKEHHYIKIAEQYLNTWKKN